MIQEIAPHKFDLTYGQPKAQDEDFVLFIKKSKTLLRKTAEENHERTRTICSRSMEIIITM